jgi:hypothetical protein
LAQQRTKTGVKSRTASSSKRMLSPPCELCVSVTHIAETQSLLSRAWLFLLRAARQ